MHPKVKEAIELCVNTQQREQAVQKFLETLGTVLPENVNIEINASAGSVWLYVYERQTLQDLMTLAPRWSKEPMGPAITYNAVIHCSDFPVPIRLVAKDGALPPTCRVETRTIEIPARTETYTTVVCENTNEASS